MRYLVGKVMKLLALTVWFLAFAVALGVIGPLGTWAIAKRYPQTSRLAWVLLGITAGVIATLALLWLVALLWA